MSTKEELKVEAIDFSELSVLEDPIAPNCGILGCGCDVPEVWCGILICGCL